MMIKGNCKIRISLFQIISTHNTTIIDIYYYIDIFKISQTSHISDFTDPKHPKYFVIISEHIRLLVQTRTG